MSIAYSALKRQIRTAQNDYSAVKYSDYDIKNAVNRALRYISKALALQNADFNEKSVVVTQVVTVNNDSENNVQEGFPLPNDFVSLVSIYENAERDKNKQLVCAPVNSKLERWQYKIFNNTIYIGCQEARMVYKASLGQVATDNDTIALPDMYLDDIVDIASMVLQQANLSELQGAIDALVDRIVPRRRYSGAQLYANWKV